MIPSLPPEIWAEVVQYCDPKTLRALSLVSHYPSLQARRHLYRSLRWRLTDQSGRRYARKWSTILHHCHEIKDLDLFYLNLLTSTDLCNFVQDICIEWTDSREYAWWEGLCSPTREDQAHLSKTAQNIVNLVSKSPRLRLVHLSIPRTDSTLPFDVACLDSLRVPITFKYDLFDNCSLYLFKVFQIPTLRRLEIDWMLGEGIVVPEACRKPGISNVTELSFYTGGKFSEEIVHLLRWPKDLQILELEYRVEEDGYEYPITSKDMVNTTSACKNSLQDLSILIDDRDLMSPYQQGAFKEFSNLGKLRIPHALLVLSESDMQNHDIIFGPDRGEAWNSAPPLCAQLPKTLQELHVDFDDV